MSGTTRTFIALPIPEPNRRRLAALQESLAERLPGVRWIDPAGLHVTLNFLGDAADAELQRVYESARRTAERHDAFEVELIGAGAFPNPRRPRVIWAGIAAGGDALAAIHHDLARALGAIGFQTEEPRFLPHATVGRIRIGRGPTIDAAAPLAEFQDWTGGVFPARELVVYASELRPTGPVYAPLARAELRSKIGGSSA